MLLITGAAGFIGGNFVHHWFGANADAEPVVVLDKLTYAGNRSTIADLIADGCCRLVEGDIGERSLVDRLLAEHRPRALLHFAAETHVDRSIRRPTEFVRSNVEGTFQLLEATRAHWLAQPPESQRSFRFLHLSTDEVYGSLQEGDAAFTEASAYAPNSPYSATKAAADHLVRAYHHTYGLPTLTVNCSNNYGPFQLPEKLVPRMIVNALEGRPLPLYGDGLQVRDWLYVGDHCRAIARVLEAGRPGETYLVGSGRPMRNVDVATAICRALDALRPAPQGRHEDAIRHVADRPGHDRRYAVDSSKIERELGWRPLESFEAGLDRTVRWYLAHTDWVDAARANAQRAEDAAFA